MPFYKFIILFALLSISSLITAQTNDSQTLEVSDDDFTLMNALASRDLHNITDERWNIYSQATYISSVKMLFQLLILI